jgi:hypothetical protein
VASAASAITASALARFVFQGIEAPNGLVHLTHVQLFHRTLPFKVLQASRSQHMPAGTANSDGTMARKTPIIGWDAADGKVVHDRIEQ